MRRVAILSIVFLFISALPASGQAPSGNEGKVDFSIHFYAPENTTRHTSGGCRLSASDRNLHVHSADGSSHSYPFNKGRNAPNLNACRFTFRVPINPHVEQSFVFHEHDLFTLQQDDLVDKNTVSISWGDNRAWEYETSLVGSVKPAPTPTPEPTPTIEPTPKPEYRSYGPFEGVVSAHAVSYTNVKESTLFTEPVMISFVNYEFSDASAAESAMPEICEFTEENHNLLVDNEHLREVSIGRIGDDRCAFGVDFPDKATTLSVVVRKDNQVLSVLAMGLDGDYPEFVGDFLEVFLEDIDGNDRSLLPELADMPRGWEASLDPQDITDEVVETD